MINQTVNWSVLDKVAKLNTTNVFILSDIYFTITTAGSNYERKQLPQEADIAPHLKNFEAYSFRCKSNSKTDTESRTESHQ